MDLQEQLEIGQQAEGFLRYIEENKYFEELIQRVVLEYSARVLSLRGDQATEFLKLKERLDVWQYEILNAIRGDVGNATEAQRLLEGKPEKGLL